MKRLFGALLAVLIILAGCASDDGGATPGAPTSSLPISETTPAPVPAPTEIVAPIASTITTAPEEPVEPNGQRSITIGGMGAEYGEPVRCVIDLGVSSRRATVERATRAASAAGEAMTAALSSMGISADDIQTTEFSVSPYYDRYPYVDGYEVNIGYRVVMPDIDRVGSILSAGISAGGDNTRAWGIRFEADTSALIEAARARAWADAETRAQSLAAMAGEPLGEVLDVHEKVLITSSQGMMQGGEGDAVSFDIPVSPGVAGVTVLLTATFAIGA